VLFIESAAQIFAEPRSPDDPRALSASSLVMHDVGRLVWLAFAVTYLVRKTGAYADDLGFDARKLGYDIRLGAGAFLAAIVPVYGIQILLTQVARFKSEHPLVKVTEDHDGLGVLVLVTVLAAVIAPLVEEFMFRVVLQGWLEKKQIERRERLGLPGEPAGWTPIALASAVFALLHLSNGPDWVALFVLSMFMGYVYQRTHRIFPSLVMHGLVNGLAMLELWVRYFTDSK
jgi:membrane protease YdiL (CAAX protease family)